MKKMKQLSNAELIQFCDQMAMTLKAGLTPAAGIELMLDDAAGKEGQAILLPISEKCNDGYSFPDALAASGVFPDYALHMIEIGNQSGKLDEVMESLVYHYRREEALSKGIRSAVAYPFLIVLMMLVVIVVLVVKVLPIFQQVFIQLGSELTGFSRSLLHLGDALTLYSALFIGIFVLAVAAYFFFTRFAVGRKLWNNFCSEFALTRGFYDKISAARFASGMSILISAGLDTEESLELVEQLVSNKRMSKKIEYCKKLMEGDENTDPVSFSSALVSSSIFNNMYSKMISIGFSTGSVDRVFHKIAESYDEEIEQQMNATVSLLEPTLVIALSIVVCLILLSVIMPLMGIMSTIG